jgi:hypothetical protein
VNENKALAVFEDYKIRRVYDEKAEIWYLSVIDIIAALIQQPDYQAARNYWKVLKNRLKKEGSQAVTDCNRLKMIAQVALCASVSSSPERASASGRVVNLPSFFVFFAFSCGKYSPSLSTFHPQRRIDTKQDQPPAFPASPPLSGAGGPRSRARRERRLCFRL